MPISTNNVATRRLPAAGPIDNTRPFPDSHGVAARQVCWYARCIRRCEWRSAYEKRRIRCTGANVMLCSAIADRSRASDLWMFPPPPSAIGGRVAGSMVRYADSSTTADLQAAIGQSSVPNSAVAELLPKREPALGETTALHVHLPPPPQTSSSPTASCGWSVRSIVRRCCSAPMRSPQIGVIPEEPGQGLLHHVRHDRGPTSWRGSSAIRNQIISGAFGADHQPIGAVRRFAAPPGSRSIRRFKHGGLHGRWAESAPWSAVRSGRSPRRRPGIRPLFITKPRGGTESAANTVGSVYRCGQQAGYLDVQTTSSRRWRSASGKTGAEFAKDWLSLWLNDYTVNGDTVPGAAGDVRIRSSSRGRTRAA